jgi:hypothetical protein
VSILVGGVTDVGTEWVGTSQGLGGSAQNAQGFVDSFNAEGVLVRFNWGDFNTWERDFKDPVFAGGDDDDWVDNVDAVFYTGHAGGDSFNASSQTDWITRILSIIVLGGMGSLPGALVAALILGVMEQVTAVVVTLYWSPIVFYLFLFLTLIVRPQGLMGETVREKA